jgi:ketosteroid isomerase-like protein
MGVRDDNVATVENYIEAYNAKDFQAVEKFFAPGFHMIHNNRGFDSVGVEPMMAAVRGMAEMAPDRRYAQVRRMMTPDDTTVVTQILYTGTQQAGELLGPTPEISVELCSIWTISDGTITKLEDYG